MRVDVVRDSEGRMVLQILYYTIFNVRFAFIVSVKDNRIVGSFSEHISPMTLAHSLAYVIYEYCRKHNINISEDEIQKVAKKIGEWLYGKGEAY